LGAEIDPETAKAIKADPDLHQVSPERIREEFVRGIASAKDPKQYLKMVEDLDLFDQVFPGLDTTKKFLDTPDATMQLVSLLRDNKPQDIERVLRDMKYTKEEIRSVLYLLKMRDLDPESAPTLKKGYKRFKLTPSDIMAAAKTLGKPDPAHAKAFVNFAEAPPAITGKELGQQGLKGPEIGEAMEKAEREAYEALLTSRG
jgi:tRNA nucleotidyltransferase/poly(A) polymerase